MICISRLPNRGPRIAVRCGRTGRSSRLLNDHVVHVTVDGQKLHLLGLFGDRGSEAPAAMERQVPAFVEACAKWGAGGVGACASAVEWGVSTATSARGASGDPHEFRTLVLV